MHSASVVPFTITAPVSDPLGLRLVITDRLEQLHIAPRLLSPAFEAAVRERLAALTQFRHPCYARVRRIDRLDGGSALALVSEHAPGARLSQVLAVAERHSLVLDINAALSLVRQLVPAVAALHQTSPGVTCGVLSPDRIVLTPHGRVVITDYVLGAAVEQLAWPREQLWRELGLMTPPASDGPVRLDRAADIAQIGAVSLALVLGRPLRADDLQALPELLASARETTVLGERELVAAPLRRWLLRALQLDPRGSFESMVNLQEGLDDVLSEEGGYVAAPLALEAFLVQYRERAADLAPRQHREPIRPVTASAVAPAPLVAVPARAAPPALAAFEPVVEPPRVVAIVADVMADTIPLGETDAIGSAAAGQTPDAPEGDHDAETAPAAAIEVSTPADEPAVATAPPNEATSPEAEEGEGRARVTLLHFGATGPAISERHPQQDEVVPDPAADRASRRVTLERVALAVCAVIALAEGVYIWTAQPSPAAVASDGSLSIESRPPGATVTIDDRERGTTPLTVRVSAGPHVIALRTQGGSRVVPVTIQAGAVHAQYVELGPAPTTGAIDVGADPAGARVLLDGQLRGVVPLTIADVPPGDHEVLIEAPGGAVRQRVVVEAGLTTSVRPAVTATAPPPAESRGWVTIRVPFEMRVFEGGRSLGTTSTPRLPLAPGRHRLDVVSPTLGFKTALDVDVVAGKEVLVPVRLPTAEVAINAIPWADVWIDGEKAGETPIGSVSLALGPHDLVFRHPDFPELRHAISVAAQGPTRVSVEMRK